MLADITRLWTDLILKCYNVLYILILVHCGRGETHRTQPKKINCAFQADVLMKKIDNMVFHLTVAFRVTVWIFLCPWLPIWIEVYISGMFWVFVFFFGFFFKRAI